MTLQIAILGPVEPRVSGALVGVPAGKQRALLTLLAVRAPHPVSAESAAEALWPRVAPAESMRSLQVSMSRLRRSLGAAGSALETVASGYRLALEADAIDARRFETLINAARAARVRGDSAAARRLLDDALALWRGPALADVRFESFAQAEIARLEELRVAALEERIDARLSQGEHALVVAELEQLAAEHPSRERLVGLLMLALYRCDRQTDALEVYTRGRQRLDEELGLEPSPELQRLQEAILRHDPSLHARGDWDPAHGSIDHGKAPEGVVTMPFTDVADLAEARRFVDGCDWDRARDVLSRVVREQASDDALEMLATAAWWLDDGETARDARERLFRLRRAAGDDAGAARVAIELAWDATIFRSDAAVARGWVARARRLLETAEPLGEHAWLALREASLDRAPPATFVAARDIARRAGDFDAEMTALALEGNALVAEGRVEEGLARMDEATAAACAGELAHPVAITFACCQQLGACSRVGDYDRATQWCDRIARLCDERNIWSILSVSRCYYAPLLIGRGRYREAEAILVKARAEYEDLIPSHALIATAWLADLRLRQGRAIDARRLLDAAEPEVTARLVRSALALAVGDAAEAVDQAGVFLRQAAPDRHLERAAALELLARGEARRGRVVEAAAAIDTLAAIANRLGTVPLAASVFVAKAAVDVAANEPEAARDRLVDAVDSYERAHAPYEAAGARLELASVYELLDRPADAERERARAEQRLRELRVVTDSGPLTTREREVLGLVAAGLSNPEIGVQLVVSTHTVHRHLSNIMRKLGGCRSRVAAVARARELGVLP